MYLLLRFVWMNEIYRTDGMDLEVSQSVSLDIYGNEIHSSVAIVCAFLSHKFRRWNGTKSKTVASHKPLWLHQILCHNNINKAVSTTIFEL